MNKIITSMLLTVVILMGAVYFLKTIEPKSRTFTTSVARSGEYAATTTDANWTGDKLLVNGAGTLGSVVVTLTSNAPLYIYDATTTGPHSDHATTTIAAFKTTTVGTYTYDATFTRGLMVVGASTVGVASTTITSRQN